MTEVNRKATNPPYEVQIGTLSILTWDLDVGQFRFDRVNRVGNIINSKLDGMLAGRGKVVDRGNSHRILVAGKVVQNITRDSGIRGGSRHELQERRTEVRYVFRVKVCGKVKDFAVVVQHIFEFARQVI